MTKHSFIARRDGSDFRILVDGIQIGRLADCETRHVFITDDELDSWVHIEPDYSIREILAAIRKGYEAMEADYLDQSAAEMAAENAWLRHAERFDPEAQADLELHNMLHPHGYC